MNFLRVKLHDNATGNIQVVICGLRLTNRQRHGHMMKLPGALFQLFNVNAPSLFALVNKQS